MCMCAETSKWKLLCTVEGWIFYINPSLTLKKKLCFHFVSHFFYLSTTNLSFHKDSEMTAPGDWGYIYPWRMQGATAMAGLLSYTLCLILMRWDHSREWEAKLTFHSMCSPQPPSWECKGKLIIAAQRSASQTGIHQEADRVGESLNYLSKGNTGSNLGLTWQQWHLGGRLVVRASEFSQYISPLSTYSHPGPDPICFSSYAVTNGERDATQA